MPLFTVYPGGLSKQGYRVSPIVAKYRDLEGGFDPAEREALRALHCVTPDPRGEWIPSADTAALAALAVWQAVKGSDLSPRRTAPT